VAAGQQSVGSSGIRHSHRPLAIPVGMHGTSLTTCSGRLVQRFDQKIISRNSAGGSGPRRRKSTHNYRFNQLHKVAAKLMEGKDLASKCEQKRNGSANVIGLAICASSNVRGKNPWPGAITPETPYSPGSEASTMLETGKPRKIRCRDCRRPAVIPSKNG